MKAYSMSVKGAGWLCEICICPILPQCQHKFLLPSCDLPGRYQQPVAKVETIGTSEIQKLLWKSSLCVFHCSLPMSNFLCYVIFKYVLVSLHFNNLWGFFRVLFLALAFRKGGKTEKKICNIYLD